MIVLLFAENVLVGHRKEILINTGGTIPHAMGIEAITEDPDGRKYLLKLTPQIGGIFSGFFQLIFHTSSVFTDFISAIISCSVPFDPFGYRSIPVDLTHLLDRLK